MICHLHDPTLMAEVHRFRMVSQELDRVEEAMVDNEDQWGELATMKLKTIRRLEMANTLQRVQELDEGVMDNMLRSMAEGLQRGRCA